MQRKIGLLLVAALALGPVGCDTPREQATEERVEDAGEAAGRPEGVAEQQGEAVKEGGTATVDPITGTTSTSATTATTATTVTTP